MRAAAVLSATVILIGVYLSIAAAFAFTPTPIGLGILAISAGAAVGLVAFEPRSGIGAGRRQRG